MTLIHTFMKEMEQISIMKISSLAKYAVGVTVAAAMLAACSSGGQSSLSPSGAAPSNHQTGVGLLSKVQLDLALTRPNYVAPIVHPDLGKSFMHPDKKSKKAGYLYVGDLDTNDVDVYDYPSGTSVGTLTGFDYPYGQCTDKKGDVYITNFSGGNAVEYTHGGTSVKNTYSSGGEPIGCSVDAKGDVAVTSFSPAEVVVFAGGDPTKGTTYTSCGEYQWTMGYDASGNLIGVGYGSLICALLSGAKSITTLSDSGITIDFPGGSRWDGKYLDLGDQEAGGTFESGAWPVTLSGSKVSSSGEVKFADTCDSDYNDEVNEFFVGKGNLAPDKKSKGKQATAMVEANLDCAEVHYWPYPAGGDPTGGLTSGPGYPNGASVSFGK
jgi:hypothetical protein